MVQNLILAFLFIGGFTGWCLFAIAFAHLVCNRQAEIKLINEIQADLKILRHEINKLK
jgi:hypothetical protein